MGGRIDSIINTVNDKKINFIKYDSMVDFNINHEFNDNNVNIIHINVMSIRKNWLNLVAYLNDVLKYIDIIVLTELKIKEENVDVFNLDGFEQFTRCRVDGRGGGIAAYVRQCYIVDRQLFDLDQCEHLLLRIKHVKQRFEFVLSCIYRPPDKNVNLFLEGLYSFLNDDQIKKSKIIMIGDLNICTKTKTKHSTDYLNLLMANGLVNTILDFSREEVAAGNLQRSCVDHVNVRVGKCHKFRSFLIASKVADHYFIGCSIRLCNDTLQLSHLKKQKCSLKIISHKKVKEEIEKVDWSCFTNISNSTEYYELLKDKFSHVYKNSETVLYTNKLDEIKPWVNEGIKKLIKEKESIFNSWKSKKSDLKLKKRYKTIRNKVTALVRKEYNNYYKDQFKNHSGDIKKIWSLTNEVMGKKKKNATLDILRKHFPQSIDSDIICNKFNNSFISEVELVKVSNVGPTLEFDNGEYMPCDNDRSLYWTRISMNELNTAINDVKCTSPGIDGIRIIDIKDNFHTLSLVLLNFFNILFDTGNIPSELKISIVTPLFKNKGSKSDERNFRPIGNVPGLAKIFEKIINNKVQPFLEKCDVIPDYQHGFRPGRSTGTLLDVFANSINNALDCKKVVLVAYIDLVKAFDTLDHSILVKKLKSVGIGHKTLAVLKNYLQGRSQVTKIGTFVSEKKNITYGLVQGGILSPGLYNVYAADMRFLKTRSQLYQFADDLAVVAIHSNPTEAVNQLQRDLILIQKWFFNNEIFMNFSKTKAMLIKSPHNQVQSMLPKVKCHNRLCLFNKTYESHCTCLELDYSDEEKYLGMVIDSKFKFKNHIDMLSSKLRSVSFRLKHIKHSVYQSVMWVLYKSLFESLVRYGINCYAFASNTTLRSIESLERNVIKQIFNLNSPYISQIMSVQNLHKYLLILKYFFKFEYRSKNVTKYNIRRLLFVVPRVKSNYGKKTPEYFVPTFLNCLDNEIQAIDNYAELKVKLIPLIENIKIRS